MRKSIGIAAAAAITLGMVVAAPFVEGAAALSPGVSFSAADLPTWQVNNEVYALGQSNGKVLVGGSFTRVTPPAGASGSPLTVTGLAVLNAETGAPDSCQFPVTLSGGSPQIRAITPSADGNTLFVGGSFSTIGGVNVNRLAQLDLRTCKVTTYHPLGGAINGAVYAIAVSPATNALYIGGAMTAVGSSPRQHFAALNATTGAVLPWVADTDLTGRAVTVNPDGTKVAIGGDFFTVNGANSHSVGVVDGTTGTNLANYPSGFIANTSVTKALTSDGTSFYGGNEGTGGGVFDGVFSIDWNTLQQRWRDTCLGATQALLVYKSTLYEATHHHDCSSMNQQQDGTRMYFNASSTDTPYLLGWNPRGNDGINEGIGPRANVVAKGASGKDYLWYGGEFTQINGHAQQGLTRFGPDDTTTPPVPQATAQALTSNAIQVRFRTVVDPDDSLITYSIYRNGGTTPVWTGTGSSLWWTRPQITWTDTNVTPGTNYTYRVTASDGTNTSALSPATTARATASGSAYAAAVIGDGAKLFWRYDETSGTWLQDKSGDTTAGLNGTYENGAIGGAAGAIQGDPSTAATFDGATQYAWSDEMIQGPKVYTVETWFKTTTTQGGKIVGFGNGRPQSNSGNPSLSSSYDRQIYMTNGGQLIFGAYNGSTATVQSSSAYNDGQWHQAVGTQGPAGMTFYVDGVKVGQNSVSGNQDYVGTWRVGYDNLNGWPSRPSANYFQGTIDDTAVYPTVLSPNQVVNHYQTAGYTANVQAAPADTYGAGVFGAGPDLYWRLGESSGSTAADSSLYAQHPATYGNGVQLGQPGVVSGNTAVTLPGTQNGGVAEAQPQGTTGSFSSELWFKTNTTQGGKLIGFEDVQTGTGSNYDKQVYMTNSGQLLFGVWAGYVASVTTPASYNDNAWHYLAATQGPGGMALYVDGALVGTNPETTNQSFTGYWRLGGGNMGGWPSQPSSSYFAGTIDEAAVYGSVLSAAQVSAHYGVGSSDTAAPTAPANVTAVPNDGTPQVTWNASTDNVAVTSYSVYRDTTAGFAPSAANQVASGLTTTSFTDNAGLVGTYYYKVVALDGAGNVSPASAAGSVTLADTAAPSIPASVTASLSGQTATVSWAAATDNVGVTGYQVYRSATSGFTPDASSLVTSTPGTSITDTVPGLGTFYYKVIAVDAAGNLSGASDQASVTVGDTIAPTAPTALAAGAAGSTVSLTWGASTDNVGVTGYTVYRSTTSGFAPSAATTIGTSTTTSYTDSGVANGTFYYLVTATDGANTSVPSNQASATVTVTPVTVTTAVPVTQDAMVAASVPSTNYGTYNQLSARGGSGASPIQSFLSFALPAAPAGYTLTGASLQVRTSGDSTAGTASPVLFNLLTGAWAQATVNWSNRPTGIGAALGTLTGATATNTSYAAALDATQLAPLLGTTTSVAMTMGAADTDNIRLYSSDNSATLRPVLQLTFTKQ